MIERPSADFTLNVGDPLQRLDGLVVELASRIGLAISRSEAQRWIEQGSVLVDGVCRKSSSRLAPGNLVRLLPPVRQASAGAADPSIHIPILFEDDHLLVVDKPAGLVVHPAKGHPDGTLVNGLLALACFDHEVENDPDSVDRPGIVHRLDKNTSGVLVVAKTKLARESLKARFAAHAIERVYEAVVVGAGQTATYDTTWGRHPKDRFRFSTRSRTATKRAVTHVSMVESLASGRLSRVLCTLDTGRTHQIRMHLSECGRTPVFGDVVYGRPPRDAPLRQIAESMGRHWLHAQLLGFVHPVSGDALRFESERPRELQHALDVLRSL